VVEDRRTGMSLTTVAKRHKISSASVCRLMKSPMGIPPTTVVPSGGRHVAEVQSAGGYSR
jgi:hypothetical protein